MPGAKIPVLEIEKLWLKEEGRGIYAHADGYAFNIGTWSSGNRQDNVSLPAASTMGWLKITWISGTAGAGGMGFIPVFSGNLIPGKGL